MTASNRSRNYRRESRHRRQQFDNSFWLAGNWIAAGACALLAIWSAWGAATGDPSLWWWAGGYGLGALLLLALNRLAVT